MASSGLTVGHRVYVHATGAAGEVVLHDPDDLSMTYKVKMDNGTHDWFALDKVSAFDAEKAASARAAAEQEATKQIAAEKADDEKRAVEEKARAEFAVAVTGSPRARAKKISDDAGGSFRSPAQGISKSMDAIDNVLQRISQEYG